MKRVAVVLGFVLTISLSAKTVDGVVVDSANAPITGATVLLKGETDGSVRSAVTRDDGTFSFVGVNPDLDYSVRARIQERETKTTNVSRFDEKAHRIVLHVPADRN